MGRIFISHSSKDNTTALSLKTKLEEQGYSGIFLDFDPMVGIPAGRDWERELYTNLKGSAAVIYLCSEDSIASRWCFAEITQARALGKAIFPIKISECKMNGLLTDVQVIDMTSVGESEAYQRLWRGFQVSGLDPNNLFDWKPDRSPYPGLSAFDQEDAAVFFGRDSDIQAGLESLKRFRDFGGSRFLVLLGPSGSGKSSLMRAGLLPRLLRDKRSWVVVDPFRPLNDPCGELAKAFAATFQRYGQARDSSELSVKIRQADTLFQLANELKEASGQRNARVLLSIDQMEELLNPALGDTASLFMQVLQDTLVAKESPVMVIGTLRSDFLGDFQLHPTFKALVFEDLKIKLMEDEQIEQVITEPSRVAGLELEAGLVQKIIKDMESPEALPLMAYTLREFWEQYGGDGKLTLAEYEKLGGLKGSIGRAAAAVLDGYVSPKDKGRSQVEEYLRLAFFKMVRIGETGKSLRKVAVWSEIPSEVHEVLERFVEKRLLTSGENKSLEVSHEALFVEWPLLLQWINDKKSDLLERQRIEDSAKAWDTGKRLYEYLLEGKLLSEADSFLQTKSQELPLSDLAQEFINQSHKKGDLLKRQSIEEAAIQWQARGKLLEGTPLSEAKVFLKKKAQEFPLSDSAKDFINQSFRKRFTNRLKLASIFLLPIIMGGFVWWYTPWGQLTQIRWSLADLSQKVNDEFRFKAVAAFAKDENFDRAITAANKIQKSDKKTYALSAIAEAYGKLNQPEKAAPLLEKAIAAANQIQKSSDKVSALSAISKAIGMIKKVEVATPLLKDAIADANQIQESFYKASALSAIAEAIGKIEPSDKSVISLLQTLSSASQSLESYDKTDTLIAIAKVWGKHSQSETDDPLLHLLEDASTSAKKNQNPSYQATFLSDIAKVYGEHNWSERARSLLNDAISIANHIQNDNTKFSALSNITEAIFSACPKIDQTNCNYPLLNQVSTSAGNLINREDKAEAFIAIARAYTLLNQQESSDYWLKEAYVIAKDTKDYYIIKDIALIYVHRNPQKVSDLLQEALTFSRPFLLSRPSLLDEYDVNSFLSPIVVTYVQINQSDSAYGLLKEALITTENIQDYSSKAKALGAIAGAIGMIKKVEVATPLFEKAVPLLNQALNIAEKLPEFSSPELIDASHGVDPSDKGDALKAIVGAISKLTQSEKAAPLLNQALNIANKIENTTEKSKVLSVIAEAEANQENWGQALEVVKACPSDDCKVESLAKILTIHAEQQHPALVEPKPSPSSSTQ